jgi:hypothetical protein
MTMLNSIPDLYAGPNQIPLAAELTRQPWLSEGERIAVAVETALLGMFSESEVAAMETEASEKAGAEGYDKGRDELSQELRAIVDECDAQDMPNDQVLAALLKAFY